mmetsp:Transcript_2792/g.5992  ORF Transcript_2792/g.5992 Transcript_2792/m.5992 type:complete len:86 (-) Transcript_2792:2357-2614(-)
MPFPISFSRNCITKRMSPLPKKALTIHSNMKSYTDFGCKSLSGERQHAFVPLASQLHRAEVENQLVPAKGGILNEYFDEIKRLAP